jgi:PAS domain S-box-containing protein
MSSIETSGPRGGRAFLLVSVLLAAGIGAAGYLYCRNYVQHYRDDVNDQLSAIAELKRDGLVQWRQERLGDGNVFFKNSAFSALVRGFLEQPEEAETTRQLQSWLGRFQANSQYSRVSLLDAQGAERLAVPATTEPAAEHLTLDAAAVLRSGQVMFKDFHRDAAGLPIHLEILVPLFGELDPRHRLGTLVLRINPEIYLYPFLKRQPTPSRTAETLLVRREGNEVVFLNELRFQTNTALNLRLPLDRAEIPAVQAAIGRVAIMEGLDYRGVPVVAVLRSIPDSPWALVARIDTAELYGPMREHLWQLAGLIGTLLLAAGASVGFAWRQKRLWFYQERAKMAVMVSQGAALLDHLLTTIPDHIYFKDRQSRFTRINEAMARRFGLRAASEAIGKSDCDFFTDEHAHLAFTNEQQLMAAGQPILDLEEMETWPDGSVSWVSTTKVPLHDEAGQVVGLVGISRNITQRKQAEARLRESELQFRSLYENVPIGLYRTAPDGRVLLANPTLVRMLGHASFDELTQLNLEEGGFHPTYPRQAFREQIEKDSEVHGLESTWRRRDGSVIHVRENARVVRDAAGTVLHYEGMAEDITQRKQAEEAVRASATLLRGIFDATPFPICLVDSENKDIKFWSSSALALFGQVPPTAAEWFQLAYPDPDYRREVLAQWEPALAKARRSGQTVNTGEYRIACRNGAVRICELHATFLADKLIVTFNDLTERKQAEAALRESEAHYRTLVANIPQKIFIKDRNLRWVSVNENFARDFGMRPADLVGKTDHDFFPKELADKYHADDRRIMDGGRAEELEERHIQGGCETWVQVVKAPVRDARGEITGVFGIFWDITERRLAEETIRRERDFSRAALDSLPGLFYLFDDQGRFLRLNKNFETVSGYSADELSRMTPLDLFDGTDRQRVADSIQQARQTGAVTVEADFLLKDRTKRPYFFTGKSFLFEQKNCVIGMGLDIAERKRAEEQILRLHEELQRDAAELERRVVERTAQVEAANKELEAFSYSVSHDLRAPLRHVQGYVDMLAREAAGHLSERGQRYMKTITDASGEMGRLIDNLLAFSRMGRAEMTETTVNLNSLAQDTLGSLEPDTRGRNIVWKIPPLPNVQGDPAMLTQVFVNLLGNAVKFTRPRDPAQIELGSAGTENGHVILFVRDNGAGFDPQYAHKLFGVFQRLHRADEFEGTGIGLANVRRIIARHGGRIWAEGKLNEGATFYFTLKRSG